MRLQSVKAKSMVGHRIRAEGQQPNPVGVAGRGVSLPASGVKWCGHGKAGGLGHQRGSRVTAGRSSRSHRGRGKGRSGRKKEASTSPKQTSFCPVPLCGGSCRALLPVHSKVVSADISWPNRKESCKPVCDFTSVSSSPFLAWLGCVLESRFSSRWPREDAISSSL